MKVFLKFILQETFDEVQILHSLIQRIDTKNEVINIISIEAIKNLIFSILFHNSYVNFGRHKLGNC